MDSGYSSEHGQAFDVVQWVQEARMEWGFRRGGWFGIVHFTPWVLVQLAGIVVKDPCCSGQAESGFGMNFVKAFCAYDHYNTSANSVSDSFARVVLFRRHLYAAQAEWRGDRFSGDKNTRIGGIRVTRNSSSRRCDCSSADQSSSLARRWLSLSLFCISQA